MSSIIPFPQPSPTLTLFERVDRVLEIPPPVPAPEPDRSQWTLPIERLDISVEWMRYCETCEKEARFVAGKECCFGLIGECTGCGEERVAPWMRVNGERV